MELAHLGLGDWSWEPTVLLGLAALVAAYVLAWRRGLLSDADDVSPGSGSPRTRPWFFAAGIAGRLRRAAVADRHRRRRVPLLAAHGAAPAADDGRAAAVHPRPGRACARRSAAPPGRGGVPGRSWSTRGRRRSSSAACCSSGTSRRCTTPPSPPNRSTSSSTSASSRSARSSGGRSSTPCGARDRTRWVGTFAKIAMLVGSGVPPTVLGLIFTVAPHPFYDFYARAPRLWGLSAGRRPAARRRGHVRRRQPHLLRRGGDGVLARLRRPGARRGGGPARLRVSAARGRRDGAIPYHRGEHFHGCTAAGRDSLAGCRRRQEGHLGMTRMRSIVITAGVGLALSLTARAATGRPEVAAGGGGGPVVRLGRGQRARHPRDQGHRHLGQPVQPGQRHRRHRARSSSGRWPRTASRTTSPSTPTAT